MKNDKAKPTYLKETSRSATHATYTALKTNLCPPQRETGDYSPELWLVTGKHSMITEQDEQVITSYCKVSRWNFGAG